MPGPVFVQMEVDAYLPQTNPVTYVMFVLLPVFVRFSRRRADMCSAKDYRIFPPPKNTHTKKGKNESQTPTSRTNSLRSPTPQVSSCAMMLVIPPLQTLLEPNEER